MSTRCKIALAVFCGLVIMTGCALPAPTATRVAPPATASSVPIPITPCRIPPLVAPTPPARIPAYLELDLATNLHMTGTVQPIDIASYRLEVKGLVDRSLSLTYDDLRCLPKEQVRSLLECPGFFQDLATWAGAPLDVVLAMAGVQARAARVRLIAADGYAATLPLQDITPEKDYLLAYEWEGQPLPIVHGYPVRAVLPERTGGEWIKQLVALEVQ
jgi:DMSO/TMAO reductase YedYZ molybdopterin-dependent catalytic subunit